MTTSVQTIKIGELRIKRSPSVNPKYFPNETFKLFSIPAFPDQAPEIVDGAEIGSSKKAVEPDTVLFSKINPRINRVWTVPESNDLRMLASTEWIQLAPLPTLLPKFLEYFLRQNAIRDHAAANVSGVGGSLTRAQMSVLDHIEVPVPSLEVQQAIVDDIETQFARLDDAEAALRRVEVRLEKLIDSFLSVFSTPDQLFDGDNIETTTLGDIAAVQSGIQKQPKRAPKENAYPYLRVANVLKGRLDLAEIHQMEVFGNELERLKLQAGDLLIVEGNGSPSQIGRMAIWDGSIENCVHQNHIIRARLNQGILPEYLEMFWNSPNGRSAILALAASTSGLYTLSASKGKSIEIPIPNENAQRALLGEYQFLVSHIEKATEAISQSRTQITQLRQSILRKAFGDSNGN